LHAQKYLAAVGRGRAQRQPGRRRARDQPDRLLADVMYVSGLQNRSHESSLGAKLRKLCYGVRFR
jgi:hypothetical protein